MERTAQDVYNEAMEYVNSGKTYHFESRVGDFKPFDGKPFAVTSEMFIKVTKGNDEFPVGEVVGLDSYEFQFAKITEVND